VRHLLDEIGLPPTVVAGEIHATAECHGHSHLLHLRTLGPAQSHGLEAPRRRRRHSRHEEIQAAIEVVVGKRCRHAKQVSVGAQRIVGVAEVSTSVVVIQIDAREVADHEKVEIVVSVEIDERARVGSPESLRFEPGGGGSEREISLPVIQEQIRRVTVVGVVVGGGHLAAEIGLLVLGEPDIEVAVAIDISDRQRGGPAQRLFEAGCELRLVGETAFCVAEVEYEVAPRPGRHQVGVRIAVHVGDDARLGEFVGVIDQWRPLESALAPIPQDANGAHHDQIQQAVFVQVVEQDRVNSRESVPRGLLEAEGPLEGSGSRAREHAQCGRVDPGRNRIAAIIAAIGPDDRQFALNDDAPGALDQVERDRHL
jgi:hypothetical protein